MEKGIGEAVIVLETWVTNTVGLILGIFAYVINTILLPLYFISALLQ
ncbi:MAG: hypothetical protein N3G21_07515 [Candidatus Hydrogenedentes bacterium]|nr:hypothetical protein [Candidatus Hydrogenedentota bacterium]